MFRYLLAGPLVALAIIVTMPIAALLIGASTHDIINAFKDHDVQQAIAVSLLCALAAVVIGTLLAAPTGYLLARRKLPGTPVLKALFDLPTVIPHPIVGIGLLLLFGRNHLLGAALHKHFAIEIISATPGIILAMLVVSSPLIVRAATEGFAAVPLSLERTARSLGASPLRVYWTISLPLAWRSIRSGALTAWARAISEFGSIVVIAYYPRTAPVLIWDRFSASGLRAALGPALALLTICLTLFIILQILSNSATDDGQQER